MPILAPQHRLSVDEYHRMAEVGILSRESRVDLLDGIIVDMLPIGPFHAGIVGRFIQRFAELNQGRWMVNVQNPVKLGPRSEPQPDFVLLKPQPDFYTAEHPNPEDVYLLVEIADSSVRYDREEKLAFYAKGGIGEFWLVNLPERVIEVYSEPQSDGSYRSNFRAQLGEVITLKAFPEVVVSVSDLLIAPTRKS